MVCKQFSQRVPAALPAKRPFVTHSYFTAEPYFPQFRATLRTALSTCLSPLWTVSGSKLLVA